MAHQHTSISDSTSYSQPPQSFSPDMFEDEDAPSLPVPLVRPMHVDRPGGAEATHRRILTRSKLPMDVTQATYVGGTRRYRGETFGADSHRTVAPVETRRRSTGFGWMVAAAFVGATGLGLALLRRASTAL